LIDKALTHYISIHAWALTIRIAFQYYLLALAIVAGANNCRKIILKDRTTFYKILHNKIYLKRVFVVAKWYIKVAFIYYNYIHNNIFPNCIVV